MALSIFFAWPDNVILTTANSPLRTVFGSTFGQGWAFFTNPPQNAITRVYRAGNGADLLATPQGKAENAFGISRNQRAQGPELAILANSVPNRNECGRGSSKDCLREASTAKAQPIDPHIRRQSTCGELILTVEHPRPWAFRETSTEQFTIKHYTKVVVPCRS
jgi:antimicrobial peptide system SdpA family protein